MTARLVGRLVERGGTTKRLHPVEPPPDDLHKSQPIDVRRNPERYWVGRGEEGVFHAEPYTSELLPLWRFHTSKVARASADAILAKFQQYRDAGDLVGMDVARKFLQMGMTRARRYANHKSGRKYAADGETVLPPDPDPAKAEAARVFEERLRTVKDDPAYRRAG